MFSWYFTLKSDQISNIWGNGILTFDTNVLLDLYRYHDDTRSAILSALDQFKGRVWLSNQVAEEFFRNRNKVILSSESSFLEAERVVSDIRKFAEENIKKLKNNRIIPDSIAEILDAQIKASLEGSEGMIKSVREKFPSYRNDDPILEKICNIFDGRIGAALKEDELAAAFKEAKRRKEAKIPPGYMDSGKDGDRPYGDYIMWSQILQHANKVKLPMIFVTSEQKEDWWEKVSGQTVGPRYELRKEFFSETQQELLFYRTDRFLEFALQRIGDDSNSNAVDEVREVAKSRTKNSLLVQLLSQEAETAGPVFQSGKLKVKLIRPAHRFTCSGHFEPVMESIPDLEVRLIETPSEIPNHSITFGTGTCFDFNMHVISREDGMLLPVGEYIFSYSAVAHNSDD